MAAPQYSDEAKQTRREILDLPIPIEQKKAALQEWHRRYAGGSVSVESPAVIKKPVYGPPEPPTREQLGPIANTVGQGLERSIIGSAAHKVGRTLLPEGSLREPEGQAERFGATAVQSLTDLGAMFPVMAAAGPVAGGALQSGTTSAMRGEGLREILGSAGAGAAGGYVSKLMPGNSLGDVLSRNVTQNVAQMPFQMAATGEAPTAEDALANTIFGAAMDLVIPGNTPTRQSIAKDLETPSRQPVRVPAGQRGSINFRQTPGQPQPQGGGNQPPQPPQTATAGGAAQPPQNPPAGSAAAGAPEPSGFGPRKLTDAEKRIFGSDAQNVKGEAAGVLREVASQYDPGPARNTATPDQINAVKEDDFFNFSKVKLSPDEDAAMRQRVKESVAETGGNPKQRIGFDVIQKEAAEIDPSLVDSLRPPKNGETLNPAVRLAARERLNAINSKAVELRKEIETKRSTLPPEEVAKLEGVADRLERDAKNLIDVLYPTRSQDGRNLAYHKIMARNSFDAEYWFSRARRQFFGALPDDMYKEIGAIVDKGQKAQATGDDAAVEQARIELARTLSRLEKTPKEQVAMGLWKAGLLTGVKTHLRNITGNAAFQVMEELARYPASMVDTAIGLTTGRRTVDRGSMVKLAQAAVVGGKKGFAEAGQILKHGATDAQFAKLDLTREMNSGNKVIDAYVNGVFRLLSAEDAVFSNIAVNRSLQEQARTLALTEAKAGKISKADVAQRTQDLLAKPTEEMQTNAITAAELATFTNKNPVATGITNARRSIRQDYGKPGERINAGLDYFMPFVKTPTNVLARTFEYMGAHEAFRLAGATGKAAGAIKEGITARDMATAKAEWTKSFTAEDQRRLAMGAGRMGVGWGLMMLGNMLAEKGLMTGVSSREDKAKRGQNTVAGRPDGAIKIGSRWFQITGIVPGGALMAIGATWHDEGARKLTDEGRRLGNQAAIVTRLATEQPMLQGATNVQEALRNPGSATEKMATQFGRSLVPTIVGDVAQAIDSTQRRPTGVVEGIQSKIPGASMGLPEKLTPLGDPVKNQPLAAVDLFNSKPEVDHPVVKELVRLNVGLSEPNQVIKYRIDKREVSERLSVEDHNALIKHEGDAIKGQLERTMAKPRYETADDEQRTEMLEDAITKGRREGAKAFKKATGR